MSTARMFQSALDSVKERLGWEKPENGESAEDAAREALHEFIDGSLIYTSDILKLWDGSTHENMHLSTHSDLLQAITESTFWQLLDELDGAVWDGIDEYIVEEFTRRGMPLDSFDARERDELLNELNSDHS